MNPPKTVRTAVHNALEEHNSAGFWANVDDVIATSASVGSVLIVCLRTFSLDVASESLLTNIAWLFAMILSIELVLRFWSSGVEVNYRGLLGKIKYALLPLVIVEILALLHTVLLATGMLSDTFSLLNLLFMAHFMKISRYIRSLRFGFYAIINAVYSMRSILVIVLPMMIFFSYLFYLAESGAQPDGFGDVWKSLWYVFVTATTVGYGDVSPVTDIGKVLAIVLMIVTIGIVGSLAAQIAIQMDKLIHPAEGISDEDVEKIANAVFSKLKNSE